MDLLLRYIPLALLSLLLALMARNRAYRVCPAFFTYVAFGVCADIARFAVDNRHDAYYMVFWATEAGYCILGIAAMYEVYRSVLRARSRWTHLVFPCVVALAVALSLAHARSVPPQVHGFFLYIVVGEVTVRFVQVLIFLVVGTMAAFFGLRWRRYSLGIAAGFGLYSTIELLNSIKISDFGTRFAFLWRTSSLVAYSFAVLIWIWFFRAPQKEDPPLDPEIVAHYLTTLEQYKDWMRRMR
ncbi:MAG: hypothetical protein ABR874_07890 [Candidatus Sulfotelmatobacter sp.]|jgi:hypothetical protein